MNKISVWKSYDNTLSPNSLYTKLGWDEEVIDPTRPIGWDELMQGFPFCYIEPVFVEPLVKDLI